MTPDRANRSFLFTPGDHARRVEKALQAPTDGVILDLEDAVAVSAKVAARDAVAAALARPRRGRAYVRVNGFATPFCFGDLGAVIGARPDGVVLPKLEDPAQLRRGRLGDVGARAPHGIAERSTDLMPILETATGIGRARGPAARPPRSRHDSRFAFGAGDYTLDIGVTWTLEEGSSPCRAGGRAGRRAAGLEPPVDTVFAELRDDGGLRAPLQATRAGLGFQASVHPPRPVAAAGTPPSGRRGRGRARPRAWSRAFAEAGGEGPRLHPGRGPASSTTRSSPGRGACSISPRASPLRFLPATAIGSAGSFAHSVSEAS